MNEPWTQTTCAYCGVGCGIEVKPASGRSVELRGDASHPANFGRLCGKGASLGETLGLEGRLLKARVGNQSVSVDEALDHIADRLSQIIAQHGPNAIGFYLSGQLLTEDYYVANKLMKGFIGSANVDTNSRLCMSSAVSAHKRAFGEDIVPGCYEDFDLADLTVFTGSNAAWCHPILFQRVEQAREERGARIVTLDPRQTATAQVSDLHLALKPGTDVALFNGLAQFLIRAGVAKKADANFDNTADIPSVAHICDLPQHQVTKFYEWVAETEKWLTVFSQGINQSSQGTDKANAIINCHLLSNRIGRPGMGPFSITGQPNAMGGREVGGLANQLAAHMGFAPTDVERVGRFWSAPNMATREGLKAVELFDAIARGEIKALWIMGTNPAVSMPNADRVRRALAACELVIVSDCADKTDTLRYADVALPAAGWGEKDGTVTNSERRISRQRSFMPTPGDVRPDWQLICGVAQRMGFERAFSYQGPHEIFAEHAALSGYENHGERLFDISELGEMDQCHYDDMTPVQWPIVDGRGTARLLNGTQAGEARTVNVFQRPPGNTPDRTYPYILNTGRTRDQWHTMTRTGHLPKLVNHAPEPTVWINEADAAREDIRPGDLVQVSTRWGQVILRAENSDQVRPGDLFTLIHWTDQFASKAVIGTLTNPVCDPISGQPELKHTPAALQRLNVLQTGYYLSSEEIDLSGFGYWARRRIKGGYFHSLATLSSSESGFVDLLARSDNWEWSGDVLSVADPAAGIYRRALMRNDRIATCLTFGPRGRSPSPEWIITLFGAEEVNDPDRAALLAGHPASGGELGAVICSCLGVRAPTIRNAIHSQGAQSIAQIGMCTGAGTNCGSCKSEIASLLKQERGQKTKGVAAE